MLSRQNFLICNITKHYIMTSSDINAERIRYLKTSNKTIFKHKFITEKKKKYKNKQNNVLNTDNQIITQ